MEYAGQTGGASVPYTTTAYVQLRDQMMSNKLTVNIRLKFLSKYGLIMYFSVQFPTK